MAKFETLRIFRNKLILFVIILFPIILLLVLGNIFTTTTYKIAIKLANGMSIEEETEALKLIETNIKITEENITYVETVEEGENLVKEAEVVFFVNFVRTKLENGDKIIRATVYYDASTVTGNLVQSGLSNQANKYSYTSLQNFLSSYGVTIDKKYFNILSFKTVNELKVKNNQNIYVFMYGTFLAITLMFGLAFSISRDNETGVSKQIAYMPISHNKYLLSKFLPYLVLGIIQSLVMIIIGKYVFKIEWKMNFWIYFGTILLYIINTISCGMLICTLKNQILVALLSVATIVAPLFMLIMGFLNSYPVYIQIILSIMPLTSFIELFRGEIFNNVILYRHIYTIIISSILYYVLTLMIMRKKSYQQR